MNILPLLSTLQDHLMPEKGALKQSSESRDVGSRLLFSLHISPRLTSLDFAMGKKSKSATAEPSLSGFLLGQATTTEVQLDDSIFANSVRPSPLCASKQQQLT